jgi:ubiquinol-cytochrome c reductase cytochrome c subunit
VRLFTRKISARLSARRRSRFAAPVVLILGLVITGALWTVVAPAGAEISGPNPQSIQYGRALFAVSCASCHGLNGEGVVTKRGTQYGPALPGVGGAAADFQLSTGRMPLVQPGAQAVAKPPVFNKDQIADLSAFVQSLGPGPDVPNPSDYDYTNGNLAVGGQFFRTNCTACHSFSGAGGALPKGKFAPSLIGVPAKTMFEAMEIGPQQMPVFSNGVLSPQDKRDIIKYLKTQEQTPNYGGFTLGSVGAVSEGMFSWLIGIGSLVGFGIWITSSSARSKKKITKGADA